jgi:hypothetical protein
MRLRRTDTEVPAEFADTVTRLRAERPEATELELDRAKRRVLASVRRTQGTGGFMRTRIALTAILALGIVTSGTGGALAVSAVHSAQDNAGTAVYPTTPGNGSEGTSSGHGSGSGSGSSSGSGTLGTSSASSSDAVSPAAQANSTDNGTLPFTGYLAIPVLLLGVALLAMGLVLRKRADSPELR